MRNLSLNIKRKAVSSGKRRKVSFGVYLMVALVAAALAVPATASAHPLGNFTINRYSRLDVGAAGVKIYYVLDMAEIPTFQEKDRIDQNHDGQISDSERQSYLEHKASELQSNLQLNVNGNPAELKLVDKTLAFPEGQGGLQTMRLTAHFETAALPSGANSLSYQDNNFSDRMGWREIIIRNASGLALDQSSVPSTDQSNELRNYPQDMLTSPLAVTSAQATFRLDPSVIVKSDAQSDQGEIIKAQDPLANLINGQFTLGVFLFALGAAFVLGILHAASPGHGKTVVAAYLVGSRGTAKHAVFLGLTVTVTHTIGVFVLGFITLFASQFILPEKLYPWLGLASGLLVLVMGLTLFRSRLRLAFPGANRISTSENHLHQHDHASHGQHSHTHEAGHSHDHDHEHEHHHDHSHEHDHTHSHEDEHNETPVYAFAYQAEQVQTSLRPITSHTHEDHADQHSHTLDHDHQHEHNHEHEHEHQHSHGGAGYHEHSHGGKAHSHLPPGADGSPVTWRKLLLFGISAGLLPCPSALVLMLSAIALNRVAFGLVLIVFFSLGLAGTLTGVGIALVYTREIMSRFKLGATGRIIRFLPVASAFVVTIIGVAISYEALVQTGLLGK
ncbi:MAG TPA: sulfite exporter TauE/SafE family protein [Chloroflexia bacterium]|nr:sulfite exporter TauE/SafE family protein [Chloroflexia bacterium]